MPSLPGLGSYFGHRPSAEALGLDEPSRTAGLVRGEACDFDYRASRPGASASPESTKWQNRVGTRFGNLYTTIVWANLLNILIGERDNMIIGLIWGRLPNREGAVFDALDDSEHLWPRFQFHSDSGARS